MGGSLILGFFDGVHVAHRAVISSALAYSGSNATLITFKDSPTIYLNNRYGNCGIKEYVLSRKESIRRIKNLGVKNIVELDFSEIANMTAENYLDYIVSQYSPDAIFTGFNHTFGHNKSGNSDFLSKNQTKYGYKYFCISPQKVENEIVSSTIIKQYLKDGNIEKANSMLGENFILEGVVKKGAQVGRTIGFPTANISYSKDIVKIPFGVYKAVYDGKDAIVNWGMRPTVHNIKEPVVEIHILNFDNDLYGKNIRVEIVKRIREEKRFSNLDELKIQIEKDIQKCTEL